MTKKRDKLPSRPRVKDMGLSHQKTCCFHSRCAPAVCSVIQRGKARTPTPSPKKELINHSKVRGIDIIRDPKLNKVNVYGNHKSQLMGFWYIMVGPVKQKKLA